MKKYLIQIKSAGGACAHVAFYADTPNKNYRIYYNGSDSGIRYEKIGNASRHLERLAVLWSTNGARHIKYSYSTKNEIPQRGTNAQKEV